MADMAMDFASILSAEYADKMMAAKTPDVIDREPIGTGPFQFVSYQKDAVIRYKAFDQHWGGRPKIDNLVYAITTDASVRYAKLKTGECHVMAFPKPADVALMKTDPSINLVQQQGLNVGYIAFNVEKKPFDSKLRAPGAQHGGQQEGDPRQRLPGRGPGRQEPDPADALVVQRQGHRLPVRPGQGEGAAGAGGLPERRRRRALVPAGDASVQPRRQAHGRADPADWEKVGVSTKLITYEWGEYRKRSKTGEQHAMMFGWSGDNGDPDNFFVPLLGCAAVKGGGNVARWCNKDFEKLVQKAKLATRQTDRAGFYAKAQEIAHEEAPWIPIAHSVRFDPVRKEVTGYKMDATGAPLLQQGRHAEPVGRPRSAGADGVLAFVLKRLALVVPTFLGITLLVFALIRLIPGDPVEALSGERGMTEERYQRLIHEFGLDRPLPVQYGDYVWRALHGDLGISIVTHEPVFSEFVGALPGDGRALALRDAVRARHRHSGRHRRRGQAQHRLGLLGDGRLAHRLLDADLLVGAAPHPHLLGRPRLDAGLGAPRDPVRHPAGHRLHADRLAALGRQGRVPQRAVAPDPAGDRARHDPARGDRAHDALVDARGAARGLRAHGAREGRAGGSASSPCTRCATR